LTKAWIASSSRGADFGARPALRSRIVAGFTPCLAAIAACADHSYCAFQNRAVQRIANSDSRGGTLVPKRT